MLAALMLATGLLIATSRPSLAIINGTPDTAHPYVGSLIAHFPEVGAVTFCTGTLIAPTVFVTAAHCLVSPGGDPVAPLLGVSFAQRPLEDPNLLANLVAIASSQAHPAWYPPQSNLLYDVGVVILAQPVTNVGYGRLPTLGQLESLRSHRRAEVTVFTDVGYGASSYNTYPGFGRFPSDYGVRRFATSRFVGFLFQQERDLNVSQAILLTGQHGATNMTCFGDSGGPTFIADTNVLAGVHSFFTGGWQGGHTCAGQGGTIRLDTQPMLSFIQQLL
jgi:secreted trypsin-like serine protease